MSLCSSKSQSLNTDQGNSDDNKEDTMPDSPQEVSIPQYRSGQFRPLGTQFVESDTYKKSQSLTTDQDNSD